MKKYINALPGRAAAIMAIIALVLGTLALTAPAANASDITEIVKESSASTVDKAQVTSKAKAKGKITAKTVFYVKAKGTPASQQTNCTTTKSAQSIWTSYLDSNGKEIWHWKAYPKGKKFCMVKGIMRDPVCHNKVKINVPKAKKPKGRIIKGKIKILPSMKYVAEAEALVTAEGSSTARAWCQGDGNSAEAFAIAKASASASARAKATAKTRAKAEAKAKANAGKIAASISFRANLEAKALTEAKATALTEAKAKTVCSQPTTTPVTPPVTPPTTPDTIEVTGWSPWHLIQDGDAVWGEVYAKSNGKEVMFSETASKTPSICAVVETNVTGSEASKTLAVRVRPITGATGNCTITGSVKAGTASVAWSFTAEVSPPPTGSWD